LSETVVGGGGIGARGRPRAPARLSPRVAYDLMSRHIKRAQKHKIKTVHLRAIFRGKKYKNNKHVHVMIFASSVYIYDCARAHTHTHTPIYILLHTHTHVYVRILIHTWWCIYTQILSTRYAHTRAKGLRAQDRETVRLVYFLRFYLCLYLYVGKSYLRSNIYHIHFIFSMTEILSIRYYWTSYWTYSNK